MAARCRKTAETLAIPQTIAESLKSKNSIRRDKSPKRTTMLHIPTVIASGPSPPSTPVTSSYTLDKAYELHSAEPVQTPQSALRLLERLPKLDDGRLKDIISRLDNVFLVVAPTTDDRDPDSEYVKTLIEATDFKEKQMCRKHTPVARLTEAQVAQAMSVIPADYRTLSCWTCCEARNSAFTCPTLTITQRIYFAYCYYLPQIAANPRMAEWFKTRADYRAGNGNVPDPKPRQTGDRRNSAAYNGPRRPAFIIPTPVDHYNDRDQVREARARTQGMEAR